MSIQNTRDTRESRRLQQAAERLLELQHHAERPSSTLDPRNWQVWSSDQGNGAAFDAMAETLAAVQGCGRPQLPSDEECKADTYDASLSVADWRARRGPVIRHSSVPRLLAAAAVAGIAIAAVFSWGRIGNWIFDGAERFETRPGGQREIRLGDGSSIVLGARTVLTTHYSADRRLIVLDRGEALFTVAHDAARPFVVLAGSGAIRALGTSFNVLRNVDRVVVTVSEGAVEVAPRQYSRDAARQWQPARLTSGEGVAYLERGGVGVVHKTDAARATAWRAGRLQYLNEPLEQVVADVNRYSSRQIFLDPKAGELLYTGDVLQNRTEAWVQSLPQIFPLQVIERDGEHVLLPSSPRDAAVAVK